jgi:hypothetical protein
MNSMKAALFKDVDRLERNLLCANNKYITTQCACERIHEEDSHTALFWEFGRIRVGLTNSLFPKPEIRVPSHTQMQRDCLMCKTLTGKAPELVLSSGF